jgi:DNA helicase-2/ATP-dependent DNA helicase PcrA
MVGDPWQALYGFRGARPEQVPGLVQEARFIQRHLRTSFRWKGAEQAPLADRPRAGQGVTLSEGQAESMDVLLALQWKPLWEAGPHVLPRAYGSATGHIHEAACTLLLSEVTQRTFGENATFHSDALTTLGIDHEAGQRLRSLLQAVVADLAGSMGIAEVWTSLNAVVAGETDRPLPRRGNYAHTARLENLRARLHSSASRMSPADPAVVVAVVLVEANAVVFGGRVDLDGDGDQAEADRTGPDGARHARPFPGPPGISSPR